MNPHSQLREEIKEVLESCSSPEGNANWSLYSDFRVIPALEAFILRKQEEAVEEALADLQNHDEVVDIEWAKGWKTEVISNMFPPQST